MNMCRTIVLFIFLLSLTLLNWNSVCLSETQSRKTQYFKEQEPELKQALTLAETAEAKAGSKELLYNALFQLGNNYVHQGRYAESEKLFRRAIALVNSEGDGKALLALEWLAYSCSKQGHYQEAKQLYERALAAKTTDFESTALHCQGGIAKACLALGNYAEAEKFLRILVKRGESEPVGPTLRTVGQYEAQLGIVLSKTGRESEAEACFKQALVRKKDPLSHGLDAEVRKDYAAFLRVHGQAQAAAAMEKQAQELIKREEEQNPASDY